MTDPTTLEPNWSVKRTSVLAQKSASALDEDAKRLNRISRKFTDRVSRKDTMANRMKLEEIQALAGEIQDMKRAMQEVKPAEKEPEEKLPSVSSQAEARRTLARSIKLQRGWSDNDPEWRALQAKESAEDERSRRQAEENERRVQEIEQQIRRKTKLREQERQRQQELRLAELKKKLDEMEKLAEAEDESAETEADLLERLKRQREEERRKRDQAVAEAKKQREEEERLRREKQALLLQRRMETEQRMAELQRMLDEKQLKREEELLAARQRELELLQARANADGGASTAASGDAQQLAENVALRAQMVEMQRRLLATQSGSEASAAPSGAVISIADPALLQSLTAHNEAMAARMAQLDRVLGALGALNLEDLLSRMARPGPPTGSAAAPGGSDAASLKAEIGRLQQVLFDPNASPKQQESANIALEKAITAYERTPEAAAERHKQKEERSRKHEAANKQALDTVRLQLDPTALRANPQLLERVGKLKALRLLVMKPEEIAKMYVSLWSQVSLQGLELQEMRALRAALGQVRFGPEQKAPRDLMEALDDRIEAASTSSTSTLPSQPAARPAPNAAPRPVPKARPAPPSGDIFAEIRARADKQKGAQAEPVAQLQPAPTRPPPAPAAKPLPSSAPKVAPPPPPPTTVVVKASATAAAVASRPPPPLAPSPVQVPPPPTGQKSAAAQAQDLKQAMERLVRMLAAGGEHLDEKGVAAETRTVTSELKCLASLAQLEHPNEAGRLQDLASELVSGVKAILLARRTPGQGMGEARSRLARTIEQIRSSAAVVAGGR